MTTVLLCALALMLSAPMVSADDTTVREASVRVEGNCSMCKSRIEKAVAVKEVKFAKWNKRTKMLTVAFETPPMTQDSLQRRIAVAGHDTGTYRAPDSVYGALPACCLYRDNPSTH